MYQISKRFDFSASHQLHGVPEGHPCARLHGHNYVVEVVIEAMTLDDRGFARVDYLELAPFKAWIDERLDHRHLNEVMPEIEPTAENLAKVLFDVARQIAGPHVVEVGVSETPKTWARYRVKGPS